MKSVDWCVKEKRAQIIGADTIPCELAFIVSCDFLVDSTVTFTIRKPLPRNCDLKPNNVCLDDIAFSKLYFDRPIYYKNEKIPAGMNVIRGTDQWGKPQRGFPFWFTLGKEYKIPNGTYKVRYECCDYHKALFSDSLKIVLNRSWRCKCTPIKPKSKE
jgi:hypothetical protein